MTLNKVVTKCPCMSHKTYDTSIIDLIKTLYALSPLGVYKQKTALGCFLFLRNVSNISEI